MDIRRETISGEAFILDSQVYLCLSGNRPFQIQITTIIFEENNWKREDDWKSNNDIHLKAKLYRNKDSYTQLLFHLIQITIFFYFIIIEVEWDIYNLNDHYIYIYIKSDFLLPIFSCSKQVLKPNTLFSCNKVVDLVILNWITYWTFKYKNFKI